MVGGTGIEPVGVNIQVDHLGLVLVRSTAARLLSDARAIIYPVYFPGLATVLRVSLLEVRLVGAHGIPHKTDSHGTPIPSVLVP